MLLSQAWQQYAADKRLLGYSPNTLKSYELQVKLLIRQFGDVEISSLSYEQLKSYLAAQTHLKPAALAVRIKALRSIWRWAHEEGHLTTNPMARIHEPKMPGRIPKALSEEDTEFLRQSCKTVLEHALIEFLYSTGCRIGEVVTLNRNAVDWENRSAVVRGKGDKEREVYFNISAAIWLRRYLKSRNDSDVALFATERKPHRMSIAEMRYIVKRIAKRAGIETNVYPHRLRHSYATHLLNNGAPLEVIQSLLGHEKLETTRLYAQLAGPRRRELYRRYF